MVDGGHDEQLARVTLEHPHVLLARAHTRSRAPDERGRSRRVGRMVLFLHADSVLSFGMAAGHGRHQSAGHRRPGFASCSNDRLAGSRHRTARGLARPSAATSYGDQGSSCGAIPSDLGGFRELPLLEDVEFVRRLVRSGP